MKSGTEKRPNPCEAPLGQYLRAIERPVRPYMPRQRKARRRPGKTIPEPPAPRVRARDAVKVRRERRRDREEADPYLRAVHLLRLGMRNLRTQRGRRVAGRFVSDPGSLPGRLIEKWGRLWSILVAPVVESSHATRPAPDGVTQDKT